MFKKLFTVLVSTLLLSSGGFGEDKVKHALVGVGIYGSCIISGKVLNKEKYFNKYSCLLPVIIAGVGKEIYDANHKGHSAEVEDALATIALPLFSMRIKY